ncbi:uncharacterized protein V1518DRAFT_407995 [Limtongia smithiae]|uniref:uncharacterized protein n=1 Tax=Limtongia smithiae TaxID=1125753 RepID=UPI0034CE7185
MCVALIPCLVSTRDHRSLHYYYHHHNALRGAFPRSRVYRDRKSGDVPGYEHAALNDSYSPCSPFLRKTASRVKIACTISIDNTSTTSYDVLSVTPHQRAPSAPYSNGVDVDLTLNATAVANGTPLFFRGLLSSDEGHFCIAHPVTMSKTGEIVYLHQYDGHFEEGDELWPLVCSQKSNYGYFCRPSYWKRFLSSLKAILERLSFGGGVEPAPLLPTGHAQHYVSADEINTEGKPRYEFVDGVFRGRWVCAWSPEENEMSGRSFRVVVQDARMDAGATAQVRFLGAL